MNTHRPAGWHPWRGRAESTSRWKHAETAPPETERRCNKCGETKAIESFPPNRSNGVRRMYCRPCVRLDAKESGAEERRLARQKVFRTANRAHMAKKSRAYRARKLGYPEVSRNTWTTIRAAIELEVSESTIARMCVDGRVIAIKRANKWRIDPASVAEMKKKRRGLA